MEYLDFPQKKTLAELGLDNFCQSPLRFSGNEVNLKAQTMFEAGVPSNFIQDGDTIIRLTVVDGYLQSPDYVTGVSGWRISKDLIEIDGGYFRGDISAATGSFGGTIPFSGVSAGTSAAALSVGAANVLIDGANKRIIVNDGTNDRVLMGYLAGKF